MLDYAFGVLEPEEIAALTVPTNLRSRAVMERIGMGRSPGGDFDHPRPAEGHARGGMGCIGNRNPRPA